MNLKNAFNSVKKRRVTARPNINFWDQLIRYEIKVRNKSSVRMIHSSIDGIPVMLPDLYKTEKEYKDLYDWETNKQLDQKKAKIKDPNIKTKSEKQFNSKSLTWE